MIFKTMLVAVDGSEHALKAVDLASDHAAAHGARLIVLGVYKHISYPESSHSLVRTREVPPPPDEALHEVARAVVEQAVARTRERGVQDVEAVVRRGPIARTIVDYAKERGPMRSCWAAGASAT
jgi:nucleotide-binding universal stress UspA family protein